MKIKKVIIVMLLQAIIFIACIYKIYQGDYKFGITFSVINAVFFGINIYNLDVRINSSKFLKKDLEKYNNK